MRMRSKYLAIEKTPVAPAVAPFDSAPLLAEIAKLRAEVCEGNERIDALTKELAAKPEKEDVAWSFDVQYDSFGRVKAATASPVGEAKPERDFATAMYG